jgi:predicted AAA+ superfamily ATPase
MIARTIQANLTARLFKNKALLVFGPRQCEKSTLVEDMLQG